jgi:hypothetical protein
MMVAPIAQRYLMCMVLPLGGNGLTLEDVAGLGRMGAIV